MYVVVVVRTYDYYTQIVSELRTKKLDIGGTGDLMPEKFTNLLWNV